METSQSICSANQLTGFYMMATLAFNELSYEEFTVKLRKSQRKTNYAKQNENSLDSLASNLSCKASNLSCN